MSCYDEMIHLFLLAMLCALGLTQGNCTCCTDGFHTLDQLLSTVDSVEGTPIMPLQGVFPSLRITCNGYLTRLIYSTIPGGAAEQRENEVFNIWRENTSNPGVSDLIPPSPSRANETLVRKINANIVLYGLDVNIPVQANDFIGFTAARFSSLLFLQFANSSAPRSVYRQFDSQITLATTGGDTVFFPLITAVISLLPSSVPPTASSPTPVISPSTTPLSPSPPSQTTISINVTGTPDGSHRRLLLLAGVGGGLGGGVLLLCCVVVTAVGWWLHRKTTSHKTFDVTGREISANQTVSKEACLSDSLLSNPAYIQHSKAKVNPLPSSRHRYVETELNPAYFQHSETKVNPLLSSQHRYVETELNPAYFQHSETKVNPQLPHQYVETEPASYNKLQFSSKKNKIRGNSSRQNPELLEACYEVIPLTVPGSVSSEIYSSLGTTAPVSDETSTGQVYYSQPFPRVGETSSITAAPSSLNDTGGVYYSKATGDQSEEAVYYNDPGQ